MPRRLYPQHGCPLRTWTDRNWQSFAAASCSMQHLTDESTEDPSSRSQNSGCRQLTASTPGVSSE